MNQERIFRTSRLKTLLLFIGAGVFAWGGFHMAAERPLIGWATTLFFGAGALVGGLLLVYCRC